MPDHDCKRLHEALTSLRSRLEPPQRDTTFPGAQSAVVMDPSDRTPDASADVHASIRQLEQAIREAGCDPNTKHDDDPASAEAVGSGHHEGTGQAGPPVGVPVSTKDGKDLGRVREVLGDYVMVSGGSAEDGAEHWFLVDTLGPIRDNAIRTSFDSSDVHGHAVTPPDRYEEREYSGAMSAEQREQRASMLRRTAEQREQLRSDGVQMPDEGDTIGEPVEQELARMRDAASDTPPPAER
ncbi:MAG: hypothetical protein M0R73_07135 [Dehalococcoidia bacterium]|nr:hypothetical protein [Dehalococcoidia bacterium]